MRLSLVSILTFLLMGSAIAANRYIVGPQRITFRSSPETTGKIINMVTVTSKMKLVEELDNGWSKVENNEGTEGFVLSRFLTPEVPYLFKYERLKKKNDKLKSDYSSMKEELTAVTTELKTTKGELTSTQSNLSQSTSSYEELKKGSTQYVQLKQKYDLLTKEIETKENHVEELQSKVSTTYIFWFVAGAGVLFIGWLIGLTTRKKKGYGSQLIID